MLLSMNHLHAKKKKKKTTYTLKLTVDHLQVVFFFRNKSIFTLDPEFM